MLGLSLIFLNKGVRLFVFGMVSLLLPIYLAKDLGATPVVVGAALATVIIGNMISNILLTWYGSRIGRKNALLIFSLLMALSGGILFFTEYLPLVLFACLIGNISTSGTEAGPFQSIETGALPSLAPQRISRVFGYYNLIGYSAASVGAFAGSLPAYFATPRLVSHYLFLLYGLVGLVLFAVYFRLGNIEPPSAAKKTALSEVSSTARHDIWKLSSLYSLDAFGGGFVTQSLLTLWFFYAYGVSQANLGFIFLTTNIITGLSVLGASFVAEKLGNLRTMVYTHLISNAFLVAIPLAGSLAGALVLLFLRQSMSQMDVPTRQAFMAQIFQDRERVPANALTNTFRSASGVFGAPLFGVLINAGLESMPLYLGGVSKMAYDLLIYVSYRGRAS